jgi:uncharacterized hydrophobic protein (TIGR00271 family)
MLKILAHRIERVKEKKELAESINTLIEESRLSKKFLILTMLSSMIAALGIIMNNVTILIGAMLIAPLLIPVISLSVGIGAGSIKLVSHSLKSLSIGLVLAITSAMLIAYMFGEGDVSKDIYRSFSDSYLYTIVAVLSGIVAVYGWLKPSKDQILPGVTIAVALVPPIAFAGTIIMEQNQTMLIDILQLILLNLVGITLGGLLTFLLFAIFAKTPTAEVGAQVDSEVEKNSK